MSRETSRGPGRLIAADASADVMVGGYRVVRLLGTGGLGEVYEASAPDGTSVALKTFLLRGDDNGLVAGAFVREASMGRRLEHPDIVKVLDSGSHGEYAYLVMEFVQGHDLSVHTRVANLLPLTTTVQTVRRVALALAAAHDAHVVHRDIKPGNVLVHWPTATIKVADFGLARLGDAFRSRTGIIAGTPNYMSPEQLAEGPIGPASDLYSLGVVLYELLSGSLPHEGRSFGDLLASVSNQIPPPVSTVRAGLPPDLVTLVARLLEKRPERRPASARQLAEQLDRIHDAVQQGSHSGSGGAKSRR